MKLRILSDLHTEGCNFVYNRLDEDVLILAGDIGVGHQCIEFIDSLPKDLQIVFVAGNHEYYRNHYQNIKNHFTKAFNNTNIHWLNNSEWIYKDVRFLGGTMWSDFGLFGEVDRIFAEQASKRYITDFSVISNGDNRNFSVGDCKNEFNLFEKFLKFKLRTPFKGKTVIVTHHCPSIQSVHERFKHSAITPYFTSNCEHLLGFSDLWIHGHTHDTYDYILNNTRVVCNPKGYGKENLEGFNPNLIVEV